MAGVVPKTVHDIELEPVALCEMQRLKCLSRGRVFKMALNVFPDTSVPGRVPPAMTKLMWYETDREKID